MLKMDCQPLELACLGRPFQLGSLYDRRTDSLVAGITLWKDETLRERLKVSPRPSYNSEIITEDSISKKTSALEIDASLKLSFLCGNVAVSGSKDMELLHQFVYSGIDIPDVLEPFQHQASEIEEKDQKGDEDIDSSGSGEGGGWDGPPLVIVSGSGKYLDDRKSSSHQARITLQYKSTSRYESLTMEQLGTEGIEHPEVFDKDIATHVVTGIEYGADAFFVFDEKVSSNETVQDVEWKLNAVVSKFKRVLRVQGDVPVTMEEAEESEKHNHCCTYHGDIFLPKYPTTFQESLEVCRQLPTLSREVSVPKRAYLFPLHKLDSRATQMIREISVQITQEVEGMMEALHAVKIQADDFANSKVCDHFSGVRDQLKEFQRLVVGFKAKFQERITPILKSVRACSAEEPCLSQIVEEMIASPFRSENLSIWLTRKEMEIRTLEKYLEYFDEVPLAFAPGDFCTATKDLKIPYAMCFVFGVVPKTDAFLKRMSQYMKGKELDTSLESGIPTSWYEDQQIMQKLEGDARNFLSFFETNKSRSNLRFVVTEKHLENAYHDTILYKGGISRRFVPPGMPGAPKALEVTHDTIRLSWEPPSYGLESVQKYRVSYRLLEREGEWHEHIVDEKKEITTITGLIPNKKYVCKVRSVCSVGDSEYTAESEPIQMNPCKSDRLGNGAMDSLTNEERHRQLQSYLGLPKYGKLQLLDALTLSWTNELVNGRETSQERFIRQHPRPIVTFMREIIATTGAYRDMEFPLPQGIRTERIQSENSEEYEDDEGADGDENNQENLDASLVIHPSDILTIALQNSEPSIRQLLLGRLFLMGHGMPVVLPVSPLARTSELKEKNLELLVWALYNIDVKYCGVYRRLVEYQAPFVGFIRVRNLRENLSKSKVINEALFEKHDAFFHAELLLGEARRQASNGIIEMAWAKIQMSPRKKSKESDESGSIKPVFILNLRGDAASYPTQVQLLRNICSLIIVFLGNEPTRPMGGGDDALNKVLSNLNCKNNERGPRCSLLKERISSSLNVNDVIKSNANVKLVNLRKTIAYVRAVQTEVRNELTRVHNSKAPTKNTDAKVTFSWNNVGEILNPKNSVGDVFPRVAIDMASEVVAKSRVLAEMCQMEFKGKEAGSRKRICLPLSTEILPKYAKNEHDKRMQRVLDSKEFDDKQRSLRLQQVRYSTKREVLSLTLLKHVKNLDQMSAEQKRNCLFHLKMTLENLSIEALNPLQLQWEKCKELITFARNDNMEWRKKKEQLAKIEEKMLESFLSIENIFRELAQIYECLIHTRNDDVSSLPGIMASLILDGMPLELLDGNNGYIPMKWLTAIFECMISRVRKIWVLSVMGIQSSGKSTMLNAIFGSDFSARRKMCTKGVYMLFFPFEVPNEEGESRRDYLVLLDTEGLRSPAFSDDYSERRDNELASLAIGLADLTLLNVMGETPSDMKELLSTVLHGFIRMNEVKLQPQVAVIHQNVQEYSHSYRLQGNAKMQEVLDEMTEVAAKEEDLYPKISQFDQVIKFNLNDDTHYFPPLFQSGKQNFRSEEYGYQAKQMRTVILEKFRSYSGRDLNVFSRHLKELWGAIMKENFAFNFRNVMEMVAYNDMESILQSLVHEADGQLMKWWDEWKGEIMRAKDEANVQEVCQKRKKELDSLTKKIFEEKAKELDEKINSSERKELSEMWRNRTTLQLRAQIDAKRDQISQFFSAEERKKSTIFQVESEVSELIKKMEEEIEQRGRDKAGTLPKVWKGFEGDLRKALHLSRNCLNTAETLAEKMKLELCSVVPEKDIKEFLESWNVKVQGTKETKGRFRRAIENIFSKGPRKQREADIAGMCLKRLDIPTIAGEYARYDCMKTVLEQIYASAKRATAKEDRPGLMAIKVLVCTCQESISLFMKAQKREQANVEKELDAMKTEFQEKMAATSVSAELKWAARCGYKSVCKSFQASSLLHAKRDFFDILGKQKFFKNKKTFTGYCLLRLVKEDDYDTTMEFVRSPGKWKRNYLKKLGREFLEENHQGRFFYCTKMIEFCQRIIENFLKFLDEPGLNPPNLDSFVEMANNHLKLAHPIQHDSITQSSRLTHFYDAKEFIRNLRSLVSEGKEEILEFGQVDLLADDDEDSPISRLLKNLLGCLERCPLCGAECEHFFENHVQNEQMGTVTLHATEIHIPTCIEGHYRRDTDELILETCPELTGREGIPYDAYKTEYPNWDILPKERDDSPLFWKRFFVRHADALAKAYGKKVPSRLPPHWKQLTEEEVRANIRSLYFLE